MDSLHLKNGKIYFLCNKYRFTQFLYENHPIPHIISYICMETPHSAIYLGHTEGKSSIQNE